MKSKPDGCCRRVLPVAPAFEKIPAVMEESPVGPHSDQTSWEPPLRCPPQQLALRRRLIDDGILDSLGAWAESQLCQKTQPATRGRDQQGQLPGPAEPDPSKYQSKAGGLRSDRGCLLDFPPGMQQIAAQEALGVCSLEPSSNLEQKGSPKALSSDMLSGRPLDPAEDPASPGTPGR